MRSRIPDSVTIQELLDAAVMRNAEAHELFLLMAPENVGVPEYEELGTISKSFTDNLNALVAEHKRFYEWFVKNGDKLKEPKE